ncbi:MAG: lysophospholipid acyltransferase family protein [Mangrovibacterium sp.]
MLNKFVVCLLKAIAHLPFWMIYALADIFYFFSFHVFGYRKNVIVENLKNSFPEKSEAEIRQLTKAYYRHFSDITLESIKMHCMPPQVMKKHVVFANPEVANKYHDQGKGIIFLAAHYNNWEWNSWGAYFLKHQFILVYNVQRNNKPMDDFLRTMRTQYGGIAVDMGHTPREGLTLNRGERKKALWLAADQSAPRSAQYWTRFLNQDSCFFSGPQKIASKSNAPVLYHYIHKVKRGQYISHFFEVEANPKETGEHAVLLNYINILEEIIEQQPAYWLWSHKRWKHQRQAEQQLIERKPNEELRKEVRETIARYNKIKDLKELGYNI